MGSQVSDDNGLICELELGKEPVYSDKLVGYVEGYHISVCVPEDIHWRGWYRVIGGNGSLEIRTTGERQSTIATSILRK